MKPDRKTHGLQLETFGELRMAFLCAKKAGQPNVARYIKEHGWTGENTEGRRTRIAPNIASVVFMHPSAHKNTPDHRTADFTLPFTLTEDLVHPTILALHAVTNMNPFLAKLKGLDQSEAQDMLVSYWSHIPPTHDDI